MNGNDFQGVVHNWDIDNRRDEEEFWKREERRLLDELDDDNRGGHRTLTSKRVIKRDRGDDR